MRRYAGSVGIGRNRQTRRYHRATSKLTRLVLIGHTGFITLDALRWLHDTKAALVHIDADAQLLTTSTPRGPGHAAIRRSQALAATDSVGLEIARELLDRKVTGQQALLADLPGGASAADTVRSALQRVKSAPDLELLLGAEAEAASAYWAAWSEVPIPIGCRDISSVPEHWRTFGKRHSLLSNGPRLACNAPNAILNYLYALLEAETTLALHTVGLDPLLGIFTPTNATGPPSRSTRWSRYDPSSTPMCLRYSRNAPSRAMTSSRPGRAVAGSPRPGGPPRGDHERLATPHRTRGRGDRPAAQPGFGTAGIDRRTAYPGTAPRGMERARC